MPTIQHPAARVTDPALAPGEHGRSTRTLRCLVLLHLALLVAYAFLSPMLQAPDEPAHADMAISVLELSGYPGPGEREMNRQVVASRGAAGYSKEAVDRVPAEAPPRPRPPLDEMAADRPFDGALNVAAQHPPVYYVAAGTFLGVVTSVVSLVVTPAHDQVFMLLRLFNILLLLPLPWFAYRTTLRLGGTRGGGHVAAAATLAIPQLHYIGASVNNDNAIVLCFAALTYLLARVVSGDDSMRTAAAIGLVSAAGSLSKVFGLAALPWIGLAYLLALRARPVRFAHLRPGLLALAVAGLGGGSWYVRNLLVDGRLQPLLNDRAPGPDFVPSVSAWITGYSSRLVQSFWGNFGYLDLPIDWWLAVVATGAAVLALAVAALRGTTPWRHRVLLLTPVLLILGGNAVQHWTTIYPRAGGFAGSQGRYLFAMIPAAVVLVGLAVRRRAIADTATVAVLLGAAVLHVAAVRELLLGFWGLEHGVGHAVRGVLAWSPLAAPLTALLLLMVPAAMVAVGWQLRTVRPFAATPPAEAS